MNITGRPVGQRQPYDRKRERPYLDTFRNIKECWACGQESDTIVPAHCNLGHDGMGMKYEGCVAALCDECHRWADEAPAEVRNKIWRQVAQKLMLDRYAAFQLTRKGRT